MQCVGSNLGPVHWELGVLARGPGKFLFKSLNSLLFFQFYKSFFLPGIAIWFLRYEHDICKVEIAVFLTRHFRVLKRVHTIFYQFN